jgi:CRP-like cAMP-binding protein
MRKIINGIAIIFFIWLVLDTLHVPDMIVNFLLVGELPGTNAMLSPTMMLAIMTALSGIIIFELLARRFDLLRQIRHRFLSLMTKRERLPKRRFGRV